MRRGWIAAAVAAMAGGIREPGARRARRRLISACGRAGRLAKRPLRALVIVSGVAVLGAAALPAAANASRPSRLTPAVLQGPSARYGASMDYDAAMGDLVLFGGAVFGGVDGDTWDFNGTTWTQLSPSVSPAARVNAMMAYDPGAGNMVLFGGTLNGGFPHGTWIWDGTTWTQRFPSPSPPPVSDAMMAYDPAAGNMVLFGGNESTRLVAQTWTWDGTAWSRLAPPAHPPAMEDAVLAYDPGTSQMVLFGGIGSTGQCLHKTWTWTGSTWTPLAPATRPPACAAASMAYDQATGQLILFGGFTVVSGRARYLDQTWAWNGSTWAQLAPATHPSARYGASMAYDQATGELILFGGAINSGKTVFGDTWAWNGSTWTQLSP